MKNIVIFGAPGSGKGTFTKVVVMDTPNAIHLPTVNLDSDNTLYDLRGVKISNPQNGKVYIVRGKKILR